MFKYVPPYYPTRAHCDNVAHEYTRQKTQSGLPPLHTDIHTTINREPSRLPLQLSTRQSRKASPRNPTKEAYATPIGFIWEPKTTARVTATTIADLCSKKP